MFARVRRSVIESLLSALCKSSALVALVAVLAGLRSAQTNWQDEWDKTLRAAEAEGQLTLYGCCYEYDRVIEGFKKKYPKIKVATVLGSGNQLADRILAERRGEKYLPDVVSAGANTLHDALYKAHVLEPIKPALILPEVLDHVEMVRRRAPLYRSGEALHLCLRRQFAIRANHLQCQTGESRRSSNPTGIS